MRMGWARQLLIVSCCCRRLALHLLFGSSLFSLQRQEEHLSAFLSYRITMLDGCGQCCKIFLRIFNVVFAFAGLAVMSLGLWLRFGPSTHDIFNIDIETSQFKIGVLVLIATGAVILAVAILGSCGVTNESRVLLAIFSAFLAVLCGFMLAAGFFAFNKKDVVAEQLSKFYETVYLKYVHEKDPSLVVTLRILQNGLNCCGLLGSLDVLVKETCPPIGAFQLYTPCPIAIADFFQSKGTLVLAVFVGIAALMLLGLICSAVLSKKIGLGEQTSVYVILQNSISPQEAGVIGSQLYPPVVY
ncbi:CD9 antigen-like [Erpetoichthys calabaricus]|uniref:CD9 antigen-like n=1 Tax=Erpetoichthys calabaricus TaxID=27687 RepID=A0A8C4SB05_ERPCA|nr:CD9 antigen-like [Erpetoichthys calabaricus]